jgi:TPR repeat protein
LPNSSHTSRSSKRQKNTDNNGDTTTTNTTTTAAAAADDSSTDNSSGSSSGGNEENKETLQAAQWLFEEGMAWYYGSNFKKVDEKKGRLMVATAASLSLPIAVAHCYYRGWSGYTEDLTKAFQMFTDIEQNTNGYHWAQDMLGDCYDEGDGTELDYAQAFHWYVYRCVAFSVRLQL